MVGGCGHIGPIGVTVDSSSTSCSFSSAEPDEPEELDVPEELEEELEPEESEELDEELEPEDPEELELELELEYAAKPKPTIAGSTLLRSSARQNTTQERSPDMCIIYFFLRTSANTLKRSDRPMPTH